MHVYLDSKLRCFLRDQYLDGKILSFDVVFIWEKMKSGEGMRMYRLTNSF
jgi:hypothetical protein